MNDSRRPRRLDEPEIARLIADAGPADDVADEDIAALTEHARAEWRKLVAQRRTQSAPRTASVTEMPVTEVPDSSVVSVDAPQRRRSRAWLPLAAALVAALGLTALWLGGDLFHPAPGLSDEPTVVARTEVLRGLLSVTPPDGGESDGLTEIVAGSTVATGADGGATLRLSSGTELRLAAATRVTLASASELALVTGALYLDTDPGDGGALAVETPLGTVRDIGTRFAVRLTDGAEGAAGDRDGAWLEVRVRDGRVELEAAGATRQAGAGQALTVGADGAAEVVDAAPHGDAWSWVMAAGPGFALDGETLAGFLGWAERETGWRVRYATPELAAEADTIALHGELGGLPADQAVFAVLPGAGLDGELSDDGVLTVRGR
jgi:ferric-dicitrate binding protein FerR (iron transport regulator)